MGELIAFDQADGLRRLLGQPPATARLDREAQPAASRPKGCVVAVAGGKGGVGKTTVAANLAILCARAGQRVLLVDTDLALGNLDLALGHNAPRHLGSLLREGRNYRELLLHLPGGIALLAAPSGEQDLAHLDERARGRLEQALGEASHEFDVVLIDTAAGLGQTTLDMCCLADRALVVTAPNALALTDAYSLIKVLAERRGQRQAHLLVNAADGEAEAMAVHGRLSEVATRHCRAHIDFLGWLPQDHRLEAALRRRAAPLVASDPTAPAAQAFVRLSERLQSLTAPGRPILPKEHA